MITLFPSCTWAWIINKVNFYLLFSRCIYTVLWLLLLLGYCVRCSVSAAPHRYTVFYVYLRMDLNKNSVSVWCSWHRTAYTVCIQLIFSKMALRWRGGDELLNKIVIFIFFAYKKYSRRFIKFKLNHWWQMDYFDDAFHTFLGLDRVIYLAVCFHPKYLKLCSEDEQSFYGFGTTWG